MSHLSVFLLNWLAASYLTSPQVGPLYRNPCFRWAGDECCTLSAEQSSILLFCPQLLWPLSLHHVIGGIAMDKRYPRSFIFFLLLCKLWPSIGLLCCHQFLCMHRRLQYHSGWVQPGLLLEDVWNHAYSSIRGYAREKPITSPIRKPKLSFPQASLDVHAAMIHSSSLRKH